MNQTTLITIAQIMSSLITIGVLIYVFKDQPGAMTWLIPVIVVFCIFSALANIMIRRGKGDSD
ncbi:hypothetical protein [Deinococcus misasensis]|uniref:hypothetical protein n=1 Tax=Deinococcus misasensis TaxID=392413 RepID=UPI0005549EB7|nr:hypothetical protein [Deinococcus misasensis]